MAIAGFIILPRLKQACHCLTKSGLGAMSHVGTEKKDRARILPASSVRAIREGREPLPASEECCPPEQNAEAVMPTV